MSSLFLLWPEKSFIVSVEALSLLCLYDRQCNGGLVYMVPGSLDLYIGDLVY